MIRKSVFNIPSLLKADAILAIEDMESARFIFVNKHFNDIIIVDISGRPWYESVHKVMICDFH